MDRFREIQVFATVAEQGGFAAAARALAMSPPAVTRAVSALEERIGTRLLIRTTRSVRLTENGARFVLDCRRILDEMAEAEEAAVGSHAAPRGELRVTAPALFGRLFVTPILGDFLDQYPAVTCQALFVDRIVNLIDEGQDVAVRIGNLPDSSLTAIRVGTVRRIVFAAPSYLKEHGLPQHPRDLAQHRLIQSVALGSAREWPFRENGSPLSVRIAPQLRVNTNDAVIESAVGGWGLSQALSYQVARDVEAGRLQTVLGEFELPPLPIHVIHQEGRMVSSKVRAFVDFMVERLRADPSLT
jgi:DNA-binding transcriptional LysR family regulator